MLSIYSGQARNPSSVIVMADLYAPAQISNAEMVITTSRRPRWAGNDVIGTESRAVEIYRLVFPLMMCAASIQRE